MADLRVALDIAEWNVYGLSYGTRPAFTLLRDHPEGVRNEVLDSARGLPVARWEDGPACGTAFPDMAGQFEATVERLNSAPLVVNVPDSETGDLIAQRFDGNDVERRFIQPRMDTLAST